VASNVSVEVAGGGSGVGIRDLMGGIVDIANCSRAMKSAESEQTKANTGKDPVEWVVGYDAVAIYVHKDNPVEKLTLAQLAAMYGEGGDVDNWSQVGVDLSSIDGKDEIMRVSRQNSSGTYFYFREVVLNEKDFKLGSKDMSGSKDVVELVGRTKGAIGYSGMGYAAESVKFVKIAKDENSEAYEPSLETVASGNYPLARPLRMYTLGQPEGETRPTSTGSCPTSARTSSRSRGTCLWRWGGSRVRRETLRPSSLSWSAGDRNRDGVQWAPFQWAGFVIRPRER